MPRKSQRQKVYDALAEFGEPPERAPSINEITVTLQEYGALIDIRWPMATHFSDIYKAAAEANGYVLESS